MNELLQTQGVFDVFSEWIKNRLGLLDQRSKVKGQAERQAERKRKKKERREEEERRRGPTSAGSRGQKIKNKINKK